MAEQLMRNTGAIVVNCLNGKIGKILERYSYNFHWFYADWHIWFPASNEYRIVRDRHLRAPMASERRIFERNRQATAPQRQECT